MIGRGLGAYAEQNVVNPANLLPLPDNMSYEQGAAFYVAYPTSYEAIVGRAQAKKGEWVLIHAAAGGVGVAAVQIAKGESEWAPLTWSGLMEGVGRVLERVLEGPGLGSDD